MILIFIAFLFFSLTAAQPISCTATVEGYTYYLSSLWHAAGAEDMIGKYYDDVFYVNICGQTTEAGCGLNSAVCKYDSSNGMYESGGLYTSQTFFESDIVENPELGIGIIYTNGTNCSINENYTTIIYISYYLPAVEAYISDIDESGCVTTIYINAAVGFGHNDTVPICNATLGNSSYNVAPLWHNSTLNDILFTSMFSGNRYYINICGESSYCSRPNWTPENFMVCQVTPSGNRYSCGSRNNFTLARSDITIGDKNGIMLHTTNGDWCSKYSVARSAKIYIICDEFARPAVIDSVSETNCVYSIYMRSVYGCGA